MTMLSFNDMVDLELAAKARELREAGISVRAHNYGAPMTEPLTLSEDDADRAMMPLADGCLDYFPNALAYVAKISKLGSEKHNPGQPMHHARGKSTDHANKIIRHLMDRGRKDSAGVRHSGNLAWRALAMLQEELEREESAPLARGARL